MEFCSSRRLAAKRAAQRYRRWKRAGYGQHENRKRSLVTSTFPNGFNLVNISFLLYPNITMSIELVHSVTKISMRFR
jgi:hypothetical protein